MSRGTSSSSSSSTTAPTVSDKDLLAFYKRKYEEAQRKEDKYKEKVDRHLKNLVTDRQELQEELLKRGEKIADLQKALVELQLSVFEERERFLQVSSENDGLKRNEEELHESIRQLLAMTHQQDLRDKIIYILKDPKVNIGYRTDVSSKSRPPHEVTANQKLKEELDNLKRQLDEVLKISKNKSDVVLEDCKQALEKSKAKIVQDEMRIRELQKKLQEQKILEKNKSSVAAAKSSSVERSMGRNVSAERQKSPKPVKSISWENQQYAAATKSTGESQPSTRSICLENQHYTTANKGTYGGSHQYATATKNIAGKSQHVAGNIISRENQQYATAAKGLSGKSERYATATKSIFGQSQPDSQSTSLENQQYTAATRGLFGESQRYATATKSLSGQSQPVAQSTSLESQQYAATTRGLFGKSQHYATATKNVHGESKRYATATKNTSGESLLAAQSPSDSDVLSKLCSLLKNIHLSLILLLKVITKVKNILNSIQATKLYHRTAKIPKVPTDLQHFVEESVILQLETSLRQCTRLAFEVNTMYKELCKFVTLNKNKIQNISDLKSQLKHLEKFVREMCAFTADNDLLNVGLRRSEFFQALRDSSVVLPEENRLHCLEDFQKIIGNCETLSKTASEAADFVESAIEKYAIKRDIYDIADSLRGFSYLSSDAHSGISEERPVIKSASDETLKQTKSKSLQDLKSLVGIYKRTAEDSERFGLSTESLTDRIKAAERVLQAAELEKCDDNFDEEIMAESETTQTDPLPSDHEDLLRNINKTLSKVELLQQGRYFKDEEVCRKLVANVNALTDQFKEFTQEVNVKSLQDQYSEYYKVTLSKLEELAKQCRNSVIAAEAQIAAHRSNAKNLSDKLKETEELLRESINECLSLKQKMKQTEAEHEMAKYTLISNLKEKLGEHTSQGTDEVIDELVSNFPAYEAIKSKPYVCMYCRHGPGHKYCEEKIKDLAAECRKFKTQLKLLKHETDQEKATLTNHREVAECSLTDLTKRNKALQDSLAGLEKRNASLLEQLKVEKNRIKNMERFRRLEIEGFQTDIKLLKGKIKELEKQLMKAVFIFESNHKDIELLKTVHETAQRSEQATAMLKRLKAKLYQLENDIKSL